MHQSLHHGYSRCHFGSQGCRVIMGNLPQLLKYDSHAARHGLSSLSCQQFCIFSQWKLIQLDGWLTLHWCSILPPSFGSSFHKGCGVLAAGASSGGVRHWRIPSRWKEWWQSAAEVALPSCAMSIMSIPHKCCRGHASWSGNFARVWGRSSSGLSRYTQWWHVVVIIRCCVLTNECTAYIIVYAIALRDTGTPAEYHRWYLLYMIFNSDCNELTGAQRLRAGYPSWRDSQAKTAWFESHLLLPGARW